MLQSTERDSGTLIILIFEYSLFPGRIYLLFPVVNVSVNIAYQERPIIFTVCDRWSPESVPFAEEVSEMQVKAPGNFGNMLICFLAES